MTVRKLSCESFEDRSVPAVFGNVWPHSNLTISFVPDGTNVNGVPSVLGTTFAGVPTATWQNEILRAAQTWANAANLDFSVVPDAGQPIGTAGGPQHDRRFGDIRIAAVPLTDVLALGHPFDLAAGTRSGDLWLNANASFSVLSPGGVDLYSVALHEIGHALGLPGSPDPTSAMFQQIPDTPRTGLSVADISAVRDRYGPRNTDAFEGTTGNETFETARELDRGGDGVPSSWVIVSGDLTTATDIDVYRVRPHNLDGGAFVVELKTASLSLLDAKLELFSPSRLLLATDSGPGDLRVTLPGADENAEYFVRISRNDAIHAIGEYELRAFPEQAESEEPDDDDLDDPEVGDDDSVLTASTPVQNFPDGGRRVDYVIEASLASPADRDVYRMRAPQISGGGSTGSLTAVVWADDPTKLDPVLSVSDELGTPIPFSILAREGGAFTIQVPQTFSNRSYYLTVAHFRSTSTSTSGNYSLAAKFGDAVAPLTEYASGSLTPASPVTIRPLIVPQSQTLHLLLTAGPGPATSGVRVSILDDADRTIMTRFASAGETVSTDPFLKPGSYRLLVATGSLDASAIAPTSYRVAGFPISDPVGPVRVDPSAPLPGGPPPPPPPVAIGPGVPQTPIPPVAPSGPNWFVTPPSLWPAPPSSALRPSAPPPASTRTFSAGTAGAVTSFHPNGSIRGQLEPFSGFSGGLRVAEADLTGDGIADIAVGTGPGRSTAVKIYDGATFALIQSFEPFESTFLGGVYVALGDLTGDGRADLVVTPDEGGGPRVRIFSGDGFGQLQDFFGIDDPNFRGGARPAIGDLDGDGVGDLVVAAGFGGGPRVAAFSGPSLTNGTLRKIFNDFFIFEPSLRNGAFISAGDVSGDGYADLIAGGGPGGGPRIYALDGQKLVNSAGSLQVPLANFFAGNPASRDGVRVTVKDLDGDVQLDIISNDSGNRVLGFQGRSLSPTGTAPFVLLDIEVVGGQMNGVFVG